LKVSLRENVAKVIGATSSEGFLVCTTDQPRHIHCLCMCMCLSHAGIVSKRLNLGLRKESRTIDHGLLVFSANKAKFEPYEPQWRRKMQLGWIKMGDFDRSRKRHKRDGRVVLKWDRKSYVLYIHIAYMNCRKCENFSDL